MPIAKSPHNNERNRTKRWFAARWFGLASALCTLVGFGWAGLSTQDELRIATERAVRVAELRGSYAHLNEWMTMSAYLAAETGDPRWVERYEEAAPRLAALIEEGKGLASPDVSAALTATIEEGNRGLLGMARAAFARMAEGDRAQARSLLNGPEFSYLEETFASGIAQFGDDLAVFVRSNAEGLNRRAWMEAAILAVGAMLVLAAVLGLRGHARLSAAMARAEAIARTDALTGLMNRRGLDEALRAALPGPANGSAEGAVALLVLDIDRFKGVNDAHGHQTGDTLLQLAARRLETIAGPSNLLARIGGDEFVILISASPGRLPIADEISGIAGQVVRAMAQPFPLGPFKTAQVSASVGVAWHSAEAGTADALLMRADAALYCAKAAGRGCFRVFEAGMEQATKARALLAADLRGAIEQGAIEPYFQPLVDAQSGRLVGYELLARWNHPERGFVSPAEFIPLAESIGLIAPLTEAVIIRACQIARVWPDHLMLACNISPLQLRDDAVVGMVAGILARTGMPAARLELEITESALLDDLQMAGAVLGRLKEMGLSLALDDFGTGYSSLRHLQVLPFDKLKIDAGFVGAMRSDPESSKIVAAVIGLGRSLGLHTVAEGVEDEATARLVAELGCHVVQGWHFGRPMPGHALPNHSADPLAASQKQLASADA